MCFGGPEGVLDGEVQNSFESGLRWMRVSLIGEMGVRVSIGVELEVFE